MFLRDYSDATLVYYDEIVGDKVRYDECDLRKQNESYEISEFAIANEISWDGFFESEDTLMLTLPYGQCMTILIVLKN